MRKVLIATVLPTIPAALILVAVLALGAGAGTHTAQANHAVTIGFDLNPSATPANTATSLGTNETCRDVPMGQSFTFDVWVTGIGHSGAPGLKVFSLPISYNEAVINITDVNVNYFLTSQGNPVLDGSDPQPDDDGLWDTAAADISDPGGLINTGSGVLARVTAQAVGAGASPLDIVSLDLNGDTVLDRAPFLRDSNDGFIGDTNGDTFYNGTPTNGTVAVNSPSTCNPDDDGDTVLDVNDNCPNNANPTQADMDVDGQGDVCDLDIDGDGFHNTQETAFASNPNSAASKIEVCDGLDNDADTVIDEDGLDHDDDGNHNDAGPDADGDTIKDCLDPTTNTDGDATMNPSDTNDDNPMAGTNDLFSDVEENWVGTDSLDACPNDVTDNAWPVDTNNSKTVNIGDVITFKDPMLTAMGNPKYNRRYDFNASSTVNIGDVIRFSGVILTSCT